MVSALLLPPPGHDARIWGGFAERFHPRDGRHDEHPDVVIGAGAGSGAAVAAALAHEARAVVLLAPCSGPLPELDLASAEDPFDQPADAPSVSMPAGVLAAIERRDARAYAQLMSAAYADTLAEGDVFLLRRVLADHAADVFDGLAVGDPHWPRRLPELAVPVLVVGSSLEDGGRSERLCRALAARCREGHYAGVPTTSDYPWLERGDEVADLVLGWARAVL